MPSGDRILFIANNCIGSGLSGGDRIFTEFIRAWQSFNDISLLGSEEAENMAVSRGISGFRMLRSDESNRNKNPYTILGMAAHMLRRVRKGLDALGVYSREISGCRTVYSVSDSYPDFLPAYRLKRRDPSLRWIAGYYLFIPPPWSSESPYKGRNLMRGLIYWLMQIPSYYLINKYADIVFVTSEPDVCRFVTPSRDRSRVLVIQGGVDITESERYLSMPESSKIDKIYDGCFIGRLHYQKGVLELVDIWDKVVRERPGSKLAIIGDGPLDSAVREKIKQKGLADNITMFGFLDGDRKYDVFKRSRVMLHPATYDSGGMACAEGMAWMLPAVSFDLEALRTYYPKGMLKAAKSDIQGFAVNVLNLLSDNELYQRTAFDAHGLIIEVWDWKKRAKSIYQQLEVLK